MKSCETCKHWDLINAAPYSERNYRWSDDEDAPREKPPHANFKWADCKAAPEGWADDFDAGQHKMAVFDGSSYHANLWTRFDHVCGEYAEAPLLPATASPDHEAQSET